MKYPVHISKRVAVVFVSGGDSCRNGTSGIWPQSWPVYKRECAARFSRKFQHGPVRTHLGPVTQPTEHDQNRTGGHVPFPVEKEAVGSIDFDDDLSVQVFPAFQGKIIKTFVELGDEVQKGQPLYTIDSPDLIQAESTLIGAAATFDLTSKELARAKDLYTTNGGVPQRELEQATSDQQTAEGALKAARDAVRVFGKSEAEIDQIIASRKIDPALVVPSPIAGQITSQNAQPGLLVQPGNPPAPYTVADVSIKWMLANVIESDIPLFHLGQPVEVKVMAYPTACFKARFPRSTRRSIRTPTE